MFRGFVASWLRGFVASWLRGFVASWLRDFVASWLRDLRPWPSFENLIAHANSDESFQNIRVLVLVAMEMRRNQPARLYWMFDDGGQTTGAIHSVNWNRRQFTEQREPFIGTLRQ
jgi:hypothetical protein